MNSEQQEPVLEMIDIQLGRYNITVDTSTANILMTNPTVAADYLSEIENKLNKKDQNSLASKQKIWTTSKNQSERDREATMYFIELRKELDYKFKDKKTVNNIHWKEIAERMNNRGFYVGEGLDGREKCRQKFVNLQQTYTKYIDRKRSTGEGKIEKPLFFEELDELLGYKEKSNPSFLIDSVKYSLGNKPEENVPFTSMYLNPSGNISTPSSSRCPTPSGTASTPKIKENRFTHSGVKSSVQPKRHEYLENFFHLSEKAEERKREEFKTIVRYEHDKKHEQMMALISTFSKSKKRKRESSDSD